MNSEIDALKSILRSKNQEIKALREAERAHDSVNLILAAFIAVLVGKVGKSVISKRTITEALGKYLVRAASEGENYVIEVKTEGSDETEAIGGAQ
jgi:hypothetical protein